ncbi:hypothetical protein LPB87_13520 [Flavobacterium sp. EDS]|uniref:hypothetical protein n=1 Tax=Flavobacterium sp. EDS TaxID=2897328 RepID=UPI001E2F8123|nr:hypothetical protein [Flavobacterium sp. EDS]MCD0475411.1 hypothetical protein [Flavobacterium sp. EDS]
MSKSNIEQGILKRVNKNYNEVSNFLNPQFEICSELNTIIYEINTCVLLDLHKATITLTNYLLERLLKIALIYNEAGIGPVEDLNDLDNIFKEPNRKYGDITLEKSIKKCREFDLITDDEECILHERIRKLLRNGFSHADSSKILKDLPDEYKMFQGSFSNPNEVREVFLNTKINPTFQALHMTEYATLQAFPYYKFVFNLIFKIEKRLKETVN